MWNKSIVNNRLILSIITRSCYEICGFSILFLISMQSIVDFVNSAINNYHVDSSTIQNVQGRLNEKAKVDGWISWLDFTRVE